MSELGVHGSDMRRARSSSDNPCGSGGVYDGSAHSQCQQTPATKSYEPHASQLCGDPISLITALTWMGGIEFPMYT